MKNSNRHSPDTIERMRANSAIAKKRLALLNHEYLVRQEIQKDSGPRIKVNRDNFGKAVARIAADAYISL